MKRLLVGMVRIYQKVISPFTPPVCRYRPTCSEYMIESIKKKGAAAGLFKGMIRILRCNPLFHGGHDPVN